MEEKVNTIMFVLYLHEGMFRKPVFSSSDCKDIKNFLNKEFVTSKYNTGIASDKQKFYDLYTIENVKKSELDKLVNSRRKYERIEAAQAGYGLDILINDEEWEVRWEVAYFGYGLEKLMHDDNFDVRCASAWKGNDDILSVLINDENDFVRRVVATRGYGLDVLRNDPSERVRKAVAEKEAQLCKNS